jgi:hypothetical protein
MFYLPFPAYRDAPLCEIAIFLLAQSPLPLP